MRPTDLVTERTLHLQPAGAPQHMPVPRKQFAVPCCVGEVRDIAQLVRFFAYNAAA